MLCLPQKQCCLPQLLFSFFGMFITLALKCSNNLFTLLSVAHFNPLPPQSKQVDTEILALTQNMNS